MDVTLRAIRRLIGATTGDLNPVVTATHASANVSTFRDTVHLADREDRASSIVGKLFYISDGTEANIGHEAAITDYAGDTRTITFTPSSPLSPQVGDEAEVWSVSERIGSIGQLHLLINYAIEQVAHLGGKETYAATTTFDARTGILTIPSSWAGGMFGGIDWVDRTGYITEIRPKYLSVRPGAMTVHIKGRAADQAHRREVLMYGYPRLESLVNETDETLCQPEWIVETVAAALTLGPSWRSNDPPAAERRTQFWAQRAMLYRRQVASGRRGLMIDLPRSTT